MAWLLDFTSTDPNSDAGDGRPWGDGTAMARRAYDHQVPWDTGNQVTPMVGGFAALNAVRDTIAAALADAAQQAQRGVPPGQRGHVYLADWQFNALRDTSVTNPWGGQPWDPTTTVSHDDTALGLVVRLMSAGVGVRLLLWLPNTWQVEPFRSLADEHWSVAAAVQDHNDALQRQWGLSQPIGVAALDLRTSAAWAAALHQKAIVVRVGAVNAAFCGGVDLAYTRRDFGRSDTAFIGTGDWESGDTTPLPADGWPHQDLPPVGYPEYPYPGSPLLSDGRFPEDLPAAVYGTGFRHWHDHYLQLNGPVVTTLEQQFAERWIMDGDVHVFSRHSVYIGDYGQVQLTSAAAVDNGRVVPLPPAAPTPPAGKATVQMWRTIPLRPKSTAPPFVRGEFTVMAGLANAVSQATELITIWDQYFWSEPLAKLLAARLMANDGLRLLIVLPPYGTTKVGMEMMLRKNALQDLWHALDSYGRSRVAVRDLWAQVPNIGVYIHAKTQTYDDQLLVCGSANMNRRSTQCDAELDCAVLDQTAVQTHLANLYACLTGKIWTDFATGWLTRYWAGLATGASRSLIKDPFFVQDIGHPKTPNGVDIPYSSNDPVWIYEPTSIGPPVESSVCQFASCSGDPKAPGRLDEITFLLERCHEGGNWPWRQPAWSLTEPAERDPARGDPRMPRLTL
jgi:phosphatidylserine/phosphatidylglycerophosphate/cardiolipin synthase-like enzyme